jgi:ankyrin repeat protein
LVTAKVIYERVWRASKTVETVSNPSAHHYHHRINNHGSRQCGRGPSFKLKGPSEYFTDKNTLGLLSAAISGDLPKAKQLVAQGADPNDEGPKNNPHNRLRLLHYAIAADNAEAVKVLVAVGADPELDTEGFGPGFVFAMTLKRIEMLSLLLDLKPMARLAKDTIQSLLFGSVRQPCPPCLELFLQRGAPIDFQDGAGYTILMRAIDAQDYDLAQWIVLQGASVKIEATSGMTPAYSVQYDLQKFTPGSPTYEKVLRLKALMEARGAVFPAPSPKEVRERRAKQ